MKSVYHMPKQILVYNKFSKAVYALLDHTAWVLGSELG
jgi:hypothetical protein